MLSSSALLWIATMAPRLEAQRLYGPICSAHGAGLHCPSCYAALAMAVAGVALFSIGSGRR
jgi:hypothetical protein